MVVSRRFLPCRCQSRKLDFLARPGSARLVALKTLATSTDPRFATRERQPGLDLLRALAIVLVVFYHAGIFGFVLPHKIQRFGWIGVDLFFVLSGYLIAGPLLASFARGRSPSLRRFFWRRALRILPAYLVILVAYWSAPAMREYLEMPSLWKFLSFTQNIGLRGGTAFSHAWSLCVEGQFYLVLPFLLLAVMRWKRVAMMLPCVVIAGGFILRAAVAVAVARDGVVPFRDFQQLIYYPTWTRLDPLTLGVSLAAIEQFRPGWWSWLTKSATWLWAPALASIILGLSLGEGDLTLALCMWQFPLIAFGMAALLVCAISARLPFNRVAFPGTAFVASTAYSVYLSHKLTIHFVAKGCAARALPLDSGLAISAVLATIGVVGALLFFLVERPFLQLRHRSAPARRKTPGLSLIRGRSRP
ncbi:MAG: acyltransferase [Chthoniobacterales bacterium]